MAKAPKYQIVPEADHVVRHVPYNKTRKDEDGNPIGIEYTAFELRPGEEYLSAAWLEKGGRDRATGLAEIKGCIAKVRSVTPRHGFAIGNVAAVKEACASAATRIRVIHEPRDWNDSYVAVRGYRSSDLELLEALATEVWSDFVLAGSIP